MKPDPAADSALTQRWYRDRFGIHDHPAEWSLNITKRAHEFCRKVWEEPKRER